MRFLGIRPDQVVDVAWVDNGPGWLGVELATAAQVLAVDPHRTWPRRVDIGIVGPHPAGSECAYEVRAFFSDQHGGIVEDPVTGSRNAALAQWFVARGDVAVGYRVAQGTRLGRAGRVQVTVEDGGQVWIGGQARVVGHGELTAVGR